MSAAAKVIDLDRLVATLERRRAGGASVALANGLFDLLHVGHLHHLEGAAAMADILVVGVNSDRSAREHKGPSRPVVPQDERALLVAGLACVDFVTVFDAPDVRALLRALRPDVHCKGPDYTVESVPEADTAAELGTRIAIIGEGKDHATSALIERIRNGRG